MKEKRCRRKWLYWIPAVVLLVYLMLPGFVTGPGVDCGLLTGRLFALSPEEDVEIVLDRRPMEGWSAELTGEDREQAIAVLNRLRVRFYYPDPALLISGGAGWEQAVFLRSGDHGARYRLWEDHVQVGYLVFCVDTEEVTALFDRHRPE